MINWSEDSLEGAKPEVAEALKTYILNNVAIPKELQGKVFLYVKNRYRKIDPDKADALAAELLKYEIVKTDPVHESRKGIERNNKGTAYWTRDNVRYALAVELKISVRQNLFSHVIEVIGAETRGYNKFNKHFASWVARELVEKLEFSQIGKGECMDIMRDIAVENRYHPIKDYLESVKWDNVPRIDSWLIRHAGAADTEYTRAVSSIILKACVKRIYEPGAKFDEIVVLIGKQGIGKGLALKTLVHNPDWLLEEFDINWKSKEIIENTCRKWIVEYAELDGLNDKQQLHAKAVLGRSTETARKAYGEESDDAPRHWVPFGTSNTDKFLTDTTGNRRWWPVVLTTKFNLNALKEEVDQIWAEAKYKSISLNESIRLDESLWNVAAEVQKNHEAEQPIYEALISIIGDKTGKITKSDIRTLLGIDATSNKHSIRIKVTMELMGWKSDKRVKTAGGVQHHCWVKEVPGKFNGWLYLIKKENSPDWTVSEDSQTHVRHLASITKEQADAFDDLTSNKGR